MFEVNLVMSTLTPDDEDELRSDLEDAPNLSRSHCVSISIDTCTVGERSSRKRGMTAVGEENRTGNESTTNESCLSNDVIRKKRRTTNVNNKNRRETAMSVVVAEETDRPSHMMPPPIINNEILSEDIEVVFQEDSDDINLVMENNDSLALDKTRRSTRAKPPARDHRPIIQHVFQRCFASQSQPPSETLGQVLAECSDDE